MEGSVNTSGVDVGGSVGREVCVGIGENNVGREPGVAVGIALCVSTVDTVVSRISAALVVGVDMKLLQDVSITGARNKGINILPKIFTF
jgi:hypothetical protein